jgi:hypothetical protein
MPAATQGIDSDTLLPISRPSDDASYRYGHENLASPANGVVLGPGGPSESREAMLALVSNARLAPNGGVAAGALAENDGIVLLTGDASSQQMENADTLQRQLAAGGAAAAGGGALRDTSLLRNARATSLNNGAGSSNGGAGGANQQQQAGPAGGDWAQRSVGLVTAGALVGILVAAAVVLIVLVIVVAMAI